MITVTVVLAAAWAVALCLSRVRRLHRLHIRLDAARAGLDAALARRMVAAARAGVALPDAGAVQEEVAPSDGPAPLAAEVSVAQAAGSQVVAARPEVAAGERAAQSAVEPPGGAAAARTQADVTGTGGQSTPAPVRPHTRPDAGASTTPPVLGITSDPEAAANALGRALARLDRAALPDDVRAALSDAEQLLVLARRVHNDAVRDTLGLRSRRLVRWLRLAGTAPMPAYFEIADPPPALTYDRVSPSQE